MVAVSDITVGVARSTHATDEEFAIAIDSIRRCTRGGGPCDGDIAPADTRIDVGRWVDAWSVGLATEDGTILQVVLSIAATRSANTWAQGSHGIVTVVRSRPAPVEVEKVAVVVAVAHKSVTGTTRLPKVVHRSGVVQLSLQHRDPL